MLSDAIRKQYTVPGETTLLWQADRHTAGNPRFHTNRLFTIAFDLQVAGKRGSPTDSTLFTALKLVSFDCGFMKELS